MRTPSRRRRLLGAVVLFAATATGVARGVPAPKALLPNLVPLPTPRLFVGGPTTTAPDDETAMFGCQPTEVADDSPSPRRCLRFETHAANVGSGPLELHHRGEELATTRRVVQRVYNSDGSHQDRAAGSYVFHATHAHFHYSAFAVASLWRSDARGRRLDRTPLRQGHKAGFCLQDAYSFRAAGPARYTAPGACYPMHATSGGVSQVSGISAGWADVYDVSVPHQYVEISGVPDGYYLLQIVLDPDRRLREHSTRDNAVWQHVRLCGDRADLVGRTASCARSSAR